MRNRFLLPLVTCVLLATYAQTSADVVTLDTFSVKDNTIYNGNVNNSLGLGQGMFAGTNGSGATGNHRALVAFDLSKIPSNAIVTNVQLRLVLGQVAGSGAQGTGGDSTGHDFTIQRLLSDWGEGTAGQGTTQIGGTGQLFAAGNGDATWNAAHFSKTDPVPPSTPWASPVNTPGGNFAAAISSTAFVDTPPLSTVSNNYAYFWNATPTMIADVQGWVQDPTTNFGWILRNTDETTATDFRAFWTKDVPDAIQGPSNVSRHPFLEVTYTTVPEPASYLLAACGAILLVSVRRRTRSSG